MPIFKIKSPIIILEGTGQWRYNIIETEQMERKPIIRTIYPLLNTILN
jgi:hypothetical protein